MQEFEAKQDQKFEVFEATHRGELEIAGALVPCAVLTNGQRVISQTGLFAVFDRPRKGEKRQEGLPSIIGAANLVPFVTDELREKAKVIHYAHTNGTIASGYSAEIVPLVCELYLAANDEVPPVLSKSQARLVLRSLAIIRALAKVGITALVDEVTGFQYERESNELQKILKAYISEDFLKWQTRFPRKYYQEIFRLYKLDYDPFSMKRPSFIGHFTNDYVYKELPPGVLDELKKKTPKSINGNRTRKFHQSLTAEVGVPHLDKHLLKLLTVMELSDSIEEFKKNFARIFKKTEQLELFSTKEP